MLYIWAEDVMPVAVTPSKAVSLVLGLTEASGVIVVDVFNVCAVVVAVTVQ